MFTRLIESRRSRQRPWTQGGVSLAFHLALGLGLTQIARGSAPVPVEQPAIDPRAVFVVDRPNPAAGPSSRSAAPRAAPVEAPPAAVVVPVPTVAPIGIPTVQDGPSIDPRRFVIGTSPPCDGRCAAGGGDSTGILAFAETEVDRPARLIDEPSPTYPPVMRAAGLGGRVIVEFVVDTLGRVEPGSVRVLEASHPGFVESARGTVRQARFVPARIRGRAVRQLVRQGVTFRIE